MRSSNSVAHANEESEITRPESGVVLVEFVYVFPVLMFLIIAGFEFGNLLHLKQNISFIAKESALYTYKECAPYHDPAPRVACLNQVRGRMVALAKNIVDNTEIDMILSVYKYRPGVNPEPIDRSPAIGNTNDLGGVSEIGPLFYSDGALLNLLQDRELIAIAEVEIIYTPVFVRTLGVIDFAKFKFYEISIY
jgi:hypothetical protein